MREPQKTPLCPACGRWMILVELTKRTVVAFRCPGCDGYWFDGGDLEQALDVAANDLDVLDDAQIGSRVCPRDDEQLWQFEYPQTYAEIDMCKKCHGLWLDQRELEEIRIIRESFARKDQLEAYAPLTGVKGAIIGFINDTIERLTQL